MKDSKVKVGNITFTKEDIPALEHILKVLKKDNENLLENKCDICGADFDKGEECNNILHYINR